MTIDTTWTVAVTDVPDGGLRIARSATEAERTELAAAFDILACASLDCDLRIRAVRQGRYRVTGTIKAAVTQACVVSLEPIETEVAEAIDVEFWPADQITAPEKTDDEGEFFDPNAQDAAEPIENGKIAYGRLVYECVSAGLPAYPRKADAELVWRAAPDSADVHPFAALAKLKQKL